MSHPCCQCVCVHVRARVRARARERVRVHVRVLVCVCVCVSVYVGVHSTHTSSLHAARHKAHVTPSPIKLPCPHKVPLRLPFTKAVCSHTAWLAQAAVRALLRRLRILRRAEHSGGQSLHAVAQLLRAPGAPAQLRRAAPPRPLGAVQRLRQVAHHCVRSRCHGPAGRLDLPAAQARPPKSINQHFKVQLPARQDSLHCMYLCSALSGTNYSTTSSQLICLSHEGTHVMQPRETTEQIDPDGSFIALACMPRQKEEESGKPDRCMGLTPQIMGQKGLMPQIRGGRGLTYRWP